MPRSQPPDNDIAAMRILVVEDDTDCVEGLARLLRRYGYDVTTAPDGPTALINGQVLRPDVVLLDLGPPGLSGYDLARGIARYWSDPKPFLIALSGYGTEEYRRLSTEAGIDLHLLKPVEPAELHRVLERFRTVIGG